MIEEGVEVPKKLATHCPLDLVVEHTVTLDPQLRKTLCNTMRTQSLQPKFDLSKSAWNNAWIKVARVVNLKLVFTD